ncbi:MAG: hypothetical protein PHP85_14630 [Gallionella sp.]|nr:hypothetical protein [Gallionella sp.]
MTTQLDDLACQLAAENIIENFRAQMTMDERVNAANFLHSEAFFPERDPRSAEYQAGVMWALKTRFNVPVERSIAKAGTAAWDAWRAGVDEGKHIYRDWLTNRSDGHKYWQLFADHFDNCGGNMHLFWCALGRKFGGIHGDQHQ